MSRLCKSFLGLRKVEQGDCSVNKYHIIDYNMLARSRLTCALGIIIYKELMKRWILVRQALAVSHSYGTQFYLISFALVFVPWYDVTIPGRHDYAYKKLFQGWTPIRPEVSVRLKDISNFKHWRNRCWLAIRLISQQNRDARWRRESAQKVLNATSGAQFAALPLVKPLVWFSDLFVNWRSRFVAKSA